MKKQKTRNVDIDYIKAFAVMMIVASHCLGDFRDYFEYNSTLLQLTIVLLNTCHVPLFLVISGYLCHEQPYKGFIEKKIKRVLIPFVFFSALKLLYSSFVSNEFSHGGDTLISQLHYSFFIGKQYWFIYAILEMYIISPLFWTKKNNKSNTLVTLVISYVVTCLLAVFNISLTDYFQINRMVNYLPLFVFGCFIKQHNESVNDLLNSKKKLLISFSIIIIFTYLVIYNYYPDIRVFPVRFFVAIAFLLLVTYLVKARKKDDKLVLLISKYSLQIMFFDSFYRTVMFYVLRRLNLVSSFVYTIPIWFLTIMVSIISCLICERIPILRIMVGL